MVYSIYILYSRQFNRTYIGQTNNLVNRLTYHNSGKVRSTKTYIPWERIYSENFYTRAEAMSREKWFKSPKGRNLVKKILENYLSTQAETPFLKKRTKPSYS